MNYVVVGSLILERDGAPLHVSEVRRLVAAADSDEPSDVVSYRARPLAPCALDLLRNSETGS